MQRAEIYTKLAEIMRDVFDDDSIVPRDEMTAADVPTWDSFNHINLIVAIEGEFGIRFNTAELEGLHNVGALVETIQRKVS